MTVNGLLPDGTCCGEGVSDIRLTHSGHVICMCCAAEGTVPIMWYWPDPPYHLVTSAGPIGWQTLHVHYPEPALTPRSLVKRVKKAARSEQSKRGKR